MNAKEIKKQLKAIAQKTNNWEIMEGENGNYEVNLLGSYMSLDPCGKYHHFLSPNGATARCERFWNNLESAAVSLGMWIEPGEGDPTDIFLCRTIEEN